MPVLMKAKNRPNLTTVWGQARVRFNLAEDLESLKSGSIGVVLDALVFTFIGSLCLGRGRLALALLLATLVLWVALGMPLVDAVGDTCKVFSGETLTSRTLRRKQRAARLGYLK